MNANARYVALAVLLSTLTLVSAAIAQQSQPQKNGRTKKPAAKPPDFSPLASMRDTLLEIKAAVGVGINYQDYSR